VDPDAVGDGEWGRSRYGCIRLVVIVEGEGAVLKVNLGHPIVTNGGLCDAARPKLLWAGLV